MTTPISIPFTTIEDPLFDFQRELMRMLNIPDDDVVLAGRQSGRTMAATLMFASAYGRTEQNSVLVNRQTLEDIRAWGVDELDEETRREVFRNAGN